MKSTEEQRQLRAALQLGEERFRAVADFTYDWETWVGPDGEVLWINPAVERITGYSVAECLSLPSYPLDLVCAEDVPEMTAVLARARALESGNHIEFRVRRKDGELRWVAISFQPIWNAEGAALGYRSSVRDIHEQKRLEAQLREAMVRAQSADRAKSEFLANVSHELRTPLQSIVGYGQLLCAAGLPEPLSKYAHTLVAQGELLHRLVNDLLDFSSLQAGVLPLSSEAYAPERVVEEAVNALRPAALAKGLDLEARTPAPIASCRGDALRVSQVVVNLLGNAIKFTDRGKVTVSLESAPSGEYRIVVDDSGPGLPDDERLFEPFRQGSAAGASRGYGVGLGLAICRRLCDRMGGRLESGQSPYGGARLVAVIPLNAAGSGGASIHGPQLEPAHVELDPAFADEHPLRILAIDDTLAARDFMQAALGALGYAPTLAETAEEAVTLAASAAYDVIFLDLQLPGMDGFAAATELRARLGARPFLIALSANALANDGERLTRAGFDGFVRKPLSLRALQALLERAHERSQSGADGRRASAAAPDENAEGMFDVRRWEELRSIPTGEGQTLLDKMSARVLAQLPELRQRTQHARSAGDGPEVARALHDLGGVLSLIGAARAAQHARRLEQSLAGAGAPAEDWTELDAELLRVQRELLERAR